MAVNKVYPRSLSKSKDARLRKKTEMLDALNVRVDESNDAHQGGDSENITNGESGNAGVLKPVLGNTLVELRSAINSDGDDTPYSLIGSVSDEARGKIYYFLWHQNPVKHSVIVYDDESEKISIVLESQYFNFYYNSYVQGAVTHASSAEYGQGTGEKTFLYFTDNANEPRCLDVDACLSNENSGYSENENIEFISMCPITPTRPIQTEFDFDASRTTSNFRNSRGLQFAYQNVYKNGTVSAFSVYSKLAVNPAYLFQGADPTPEVDAYNVLKVRIPTQNNNVESIRLYGREGNDGAWFFIDDFVESETATRRDWSGPFGGHYTQTQEGTPVVPFTYNTFTFYNDRLVSYIPEDITFKQFDSVPKLAEALAISNDRLFMGNYVEGYDKPEVSANLSYLPQSRPEDFQSIDLSLIPEVRVIGNQSGVKNRISGYRLDMSGVADVLSSGSTLNVSVSLNPDQNIHLYQSKDSFHSSRFVTFNDPDDATLVRDVFDNTGSQDINSIMSSEEFHPSKQCAGKVTGTNRTFKGRAFTVKDIGWDPLASVVDTQQNSPSASWTSVNGEVEIAYGTSASNPLILQGKPMTFFVRIFINNDISKSDLSGLLGDILSGKEVVPPRIDVNPGPGQIVSNDVLVLDVKTSSSYTIDCGLNNYDYINRGSSNNKKICFAVDRTFAESNPELIPPCGYFIVNKADITFGLVNITESDTFDSSRKNAAGSFEDQLFTGSPSSQTDDIFFGLDVRDIGQAEVFTCIPDIKGGYMHTANVGASKLDDLFLFGAAQNVPRPGSNNIRGWVVLSRGTAAAIVNQSISGSQLIDAITQQQSKIDVQTMIDGSYAGGQYANEGINSLPFRIEFDPGVVEYNIDTSPSFGNIENVRKILGYFNPPGRSVSSPGAETTADEGRGGLDVATSTGRIICTRQRIVEELAVQFGSSTNIIDDAQAISKNLLGYTLVDGESGPGSNSFIGSINSSILRDGILYHTAGTGEKPGTPNALAGITDPFNNIGGLNGNLSLGGSVNTAAPGVSYALPLGYYNNVFEYYMAYVQNGDLGADPSIILDINPNTANLNAYDGRLDGNIRNVGGANINFSDFADSITQNEDLGTYVIDDIMGWYRQTIPAVEITQQISFLQEGGDVADRKSFKSNANHSFGIVYSDFFGRQSSVFPLGSAFVPPYESQVGGDGGAVSMQIDITSAPPEWAHSYQIVYGGNSTYNNFIQYSAGGAFISQVDLAEVNDDLGFVSTGNIYVSLNYLQENSDVSYAKAFGARPSDGSDRFYEYRPGDKLRIISYYEGGSRIFANNLVFDVVGTATLGDTEDNPLHSSLNSTPVPNFKQGSFVILRNNPAAVGFNVNSIKDGGNTLPSTSSLWNNRCVFELYSPASLTDLDDTAFFEIGESYKILKSITTDSSGQEIATATHQYNPMVLTDGDVYFRRHAVNLPSLSQGSYQSIINAEESSTPSFFNYYLESPTFNDNVLRADQHDYGRIKAVVPNASEVRRYSSIIFSDQDDYSDAQLRLNSFDATKQPFKDVPNSYGNISAILDYNDALFIFQQTKTSLIPVNRQIISDVSGNESIIATSKVLGNQRYWAGENGCHTNPESIAVVGNTIYWANRKRAKVYKFNNANGVKAISDMGMASYFTKFFNDLNEGAGEPRVVGGYDPNYDEYILSAYNQQVIDFTPDIIPEIDTGTDDDFGSDTFDDLNEEVTSDGLTAEEEAALLADLATTEADLAAALQTIAELNAQIAELIAQLNSQGDGDDGVLPTGLSDLVEEINDLNNEANNLENFTIESINQQVAEHLITHGLANETFSLANSLLSQFGFEYSEGVAVFAGGQTTGFEDPDEVFSYAGSDLPLTDIISSIGSSLNEIYASYNTFSTATDQIALRDGTPFTFQSCYGAGPNPPAGTVIGDGGAEAYTTYKATINLLRQNVQTFGITEAIDSLKDEVDSLNTEVSELQQTKGELLNQIWEFTLGFEDFDLPDVSGDDANDIATNTGDFTISVSSQDPNGTLLDDTISIIQGLKATGGDAAAIENYLFSADGTFNLIGSATVQDYIQSGVNSIVNIPSRNQRILGQNIITGLEITRNSLAQALINNSTAIANATSDSETDLFTSLITLGIDPGLAGVILSGDAGGPLALISELDENGDNVITDAEVAGLLPTISFESALDDVVSGLGGETVLNTGAWDALKGPIGTVFDEVLDLSEALGMEDETSGGAQDGFLINDIGVLQELRDAITSTEWSEGNPDVILEVANKLNRRISSNFSDQADLIKIFETLQNKFVQIAQLPLERGYSNTYPVADVNSGTTEIALRNSIWKSSWHNAVSNIVGDLDETIKMLQDFQNLFSGDSEQDLSVITDFEGGSFDVSIGNPTSLGANQLAVGLDGVTAQSLLSGENYSVQNTSPGGGTAEKRSSFYGLSSALERINTSIKSVIESADALDQSRITNFTNSYSLLDSDPGAGLGNFIVNSDGSDVDSRDQNIRAIIGGNVTTDLTSSFNKTTFNATQVVERVEGALNPDSEFFNPAFALSIRDTLLQTQNEISQDLSPGAQGDLNGDGLTGTQDLLEFLSFFGQQVDSYNLSTLVSDGVPVALQSLVDAIEAEDDLAFLPTADDIYTPEDQVDYDGL